MSSAYTLAKFIHILIAIVALGSSAGLGILLELYGSHPTHGAYVLRAIQRLVALLIVPGYLLMLATGLWMVHLSWPLATGWIQTALVLWGIGLLLLATFRVVLRRQLQLSETGDTASGAYRRISLLGRGLGAGLGLVTIIVVYLMAFKPDW